MTAGAYPAGSFARLRMTGGTCFVFFCLFASALHAAPLPAGDAAAVGFSVERLERIHGLVQGQVDEAKCAGAITLIARDGRIVDVRTYGWRDVAAKIPMERDSLLAIYSLTKPVIAVMTLMLWEEGRFSLDDPIAKYLPEFKDLKVAVGGTPDKPQFEPARPITIRHLLTHTAGFSYDWNAAPAVKPYYEKAALFTSPTMPEFARALAQIPLNHQPGDAFLYGASFDVLGYLIETLAGQPLERVLQQRLFDPLGMQDTFFVIPPEKRSRLAVVHRRDATGVLRPEPADPVTARALGGRVFPNGSGGLISTADDYARFAQMLLNRGELDGVRLLAPKTVAFMTSDHLKQIKTPTTFMGPAGTYGLGVGVWAAGSGSDSPASAGRFGWTGYATTYCNIDPVEGTIALVFAQHVPYDEFGLFPRFSTTFYQAIVTSRAR
jgi:CubicO group peptidase (beta-lactamase class C family)